jgi:ATP-binding cassette subfamily B protein
MKNRTSFVIAQRISTVRNADVILLLDAGKIIGRGTHEELLRENAVYGDIIDSQFGHQLAHEGAPR